MYICCMRTEQLNSNNMETSKNEVVTILTESINTSRGYIAQMEQRLASLQGSRPYFVKVNAAYYVGADGNGMSTLANVVNAHAFPTKRDAAGNAQRATYTNNVTGRKFKAESVQLAQDALIFEINQANKAVADMEHALAEVTK